MASRHLANTIDTATRTVDQSRAREDQWLDSITPDEARTFGRVLNILTHAAYERKHRAEVLEIKGTDRVRAWNHLVSFRAIALSGQCEAVRDAYRAGCEAVDREWYGDEGTDPKGGNA